MNLKEIDGVTWCDVNKVIPGLDILEEYLGNGAEIKRQDNLWWLLDQSGEGLYCGSTIRALLVSIILGG